MFLVISFLCGESVTQGASQLVVLPSLGFHFLLSPASGKGKRAFRARSFLKSLLEISVHHLPLTSHWLNSSHTAIPNSKEDPRNVSRSYGQEETNMDFGRVGILKVLFGKFSFRYISLYQLRMCCQFSPFPN